MLLQFAREQESLADRKENLDLRVAKPDERLIVERNIYMRTER